MIRRIVLVLVGLFGTGYWLSYVHPDASDPSYEAGLIFAAIPVVGAILGMALPILPGMGLVILAVLLLNGGEGASDSWFVFCGILAVEGLLAFICPRADLKEPRSRAWAGALKLRDLDSNPPEAFSSIGDLRGQILGWVPSIRHDHQEWLHGEGGVVASVQWEGRLADNLTAETHQGTWQVNLNKSIFDPLQLLFPEPHHDVLAVQGPTASENHTFRMGSLNHGLRRAACLQSPWDQQLVMEDFLKFWRKLHLTWLDSAGTPLLDVTNPPEDSKFEITPEGWALPEGQLIPLILAAKWASVNNTLWAPDG